MLDPASRDRIATGEVSVSSRTPVWRTSQAVRRSTSPLSSATASVCMRSSGGRRGASDVVPGQRRRLAAPPATGGRRPRQGTRGGGAQREGAGNYRESEE